MVRLDLRRNVPICGRRLDHIRVQRPLRQKLDVAERLRLPLEDAHEALADQLAFGLWIRNPFERLEELFLRVYRYQRDLEIVVEGPDHLLRLALAQQPGIDEDALQPIADRLR